MSDRPVAETSTWQHPTHTRETFMLPAWFKPVIPASERPQTHSLRRAAARNGLLYKILSRVIKFLSVHLCEFSSLCLPLSLSRAVYCGETLITTVLVCCIPVTNDTAMGTQCPRHELDPLVIEENLRQWGGAPLSFVKQLVPAFPRDGLLAPPAATENLMPLHSGWEVNYEWAKVVSANGLLSL